MAAAELEGGESQTLLVWLTLKRQIYYGGVHWESSDCPKKNPQVTKAKAR